MDKLGIAGFIIFLLFSSLSFSLIIGIKDEVNLKEYKKEMEVKCLDHSRKIAELEKEVRLLKTDVYFLSYGWESEQEGQKQ